MQALLIDVVLKATVVRRWWGGETHIFVSNKLLKVE